MKKYNVLFAMIALVFASLACQTLMGDGSGAPVLPPNDGGGMEFPTVPPEATNDDGSDFEIPTIPPIATDDNGNVTIGGESPFPMPSDAFNIISTPDTLMYQTKLSPDDMMKFYRDEFGKQGFSEDESVTANFNGIIAMSFTGNGKIIVLGSVPLGDGSISVTITYQK